MSIHQQLIKDIVRKVQFFHNFTPVQAEQILVNCQRLRFDAGTVLIQEGTAGEELYILLAGTLQVTINKGKTVLADIRPIKVVGEVAMLLHQPRSASVIARTDCHVLKISRADLQPYFKNDLQMELQLYRNLCEAVCDKLLQNNLIFEKYTKLLKRSRNMRPAKTFKPRTTLKRKSPQARSRR